MRSGKKQFYLGAVLAWACWLAGCAKVEELAKTATDSAKETVAAQAAKPTANKPQEIPATPSPAPAAAAKVDSQRVLREFLALARSEIRDEHLARLASMDAAHREQVLQLDLAGAAIGAEGIRTLTSFPNLAELNLDEASGLSPPDLGPLGQLTNLRSLSLAFSGAADDTTPAILAKLGGLERLVLTAVPISDDGLKTLAQIKSLKYLDVSENTALSGPGLAVLASLPALQGLNLTSNRNFGEQGLLELTRCENLSELNLSSCGLSDQHFSILKAWPKLRSLKCNNNPLTDQGMVFIKPLSKLVELDLRYTRVGDQGFSQVGSRNLERLWLMGISDQGLTLIKRFPDLRELYLSECGISDQGLLQLKGLRQLAVLDLSHTAVTDRGLSELVGLKSLKCIHLTKTGVSAAGVEGIKNAIPGLDVIDRDQ